MNAPGQPVMRADLPDGFDAERVAKALPFFRIMAFVVGIGLLVLCVEMYLSYGPPQLKGTANPLHWWPQPHGFIYMVYLVAVVRLGMPARWSLGRLVGVMLAGCVPFVSFWVEHVMAQRVKRDLTVARSVR